jgi:hypothetical protein
MEGQPCAVSLDGEKIFITLDGGGAPHWITLSFDEASALAMTLPRLLTMAMSRRFADTTKRHVYPVHGHTVECASDQRHVRLTLSCGGGCDVVFGVDTHMIPRLTRDLSAGHALLNTPPSLRPS